MEKNQKYSLKTSIGKLMLFVGLSTGIVYLLGHYGNVEAITNEKIVTDQFTPTHSMVYKLGDEFNYDESIRNYDTTRERASLIIKDEIKEKEAERLAKEEAEKKAQEEKALAKEAELAAEAAKNKASNQTASSTTQPASTATTSTSTQSGSSTQTAPAKTQQKVATAPAPQAAPKPAPKSTIGANKIGINGTYKSYSNYGYATTAQYQAGIDAGLIVAGITNFNGNDGQTTYFGGHNPGIMKFIANNIYNGAIITITDGNGNEFKYKMIDKVDVDEYGEGMLQSIGVSAISAYAYGTNTESILVHFCNTNNNLMSFWYGVRI